ncbi:MAG TPA: DUF302 domain-containing protein [Puia sp.]
MPLPPPLLPNGITSKQSSYSVKESIDRLQKALEAKGITIFSRIDQQAEAQKVGLKLSPVEFLLFGNPRAGTPIMSAVPLSALDLPLKAIAWQDEEGKVWLSYNEPAYIQQRYGLPDALVKNIDFGPLIDQALS